MCTMCFAAVIESGCGFSNATVTVSATILETGDAPDGLDGVPPLTIAVGDEFLGNLTLGDTDIVAVTLVAGRSYVIDLRGTGASPVGDTILSVMDASGAQVAFDDDGGEGSNSALTFVPTVGGTYYLQAGSFLGSYPGGYRLAVSEILPPPVGTLNEMADFLTDGFWEAWGSNRQSFDTTGSNVITYDLSGLTVAGQQLALWAMEAWEMVADIEFQAAAAGVAEIVFDDEFAGAYASNSVTGNTITSVAVNVSETWLATYGTDYDSYSYQAYVHEIGHALGLGHQGFYNGTGNYATDADFLNDSWSLSIMSYFHQDNNTNDPGSFALLLTAMSVDIIAIQNLYGAAQGGATAGNTVWGEGNTLNNALGSFFTDIFEGGRGMSDLSLTIFDEGGIDTIRMTGDMTDQVVSLLSAGRSNVMGGVGNLNIARGTIIENFEAGSGHDRVTGNVANNILSGNVGRDRLIGGRGDDTLDGGAGNDNLQGGADHDRLIGRDGADFLYGGTGNDALFGGFGADRLDGGEGSDQMRGGGGVDVFVFGSGRDTIFGFSDNEDRLHIDADLLPGAANWAGLAARAVDRADRVVFDFGGGAVLTIFGVMDVNVLENDFVLV